MGNLTVPIPITTLEIWILTKWFRVAKKADFMNKSVALEGYRGSVFDPHCAKEEVLPLTITVFTFHSVKAIALFRNKILISSSPTPSILI